MLMLTVLFSATLIHISVAVPFDLSNRWTKIDSGFAPKAYQSDFDFIHHSSEDKKHDFHLAAGKFICPDHYGNFSDPENCAYYYVCQHKNPRRIRCEKGYRFDKISKVCVPKTNVTCASRGEYDEFQKIDFKCPYQFGPFTHPKDCSKYYLCLFNKPALKICNESELFDTGSKACKDKDKVSCGSRFNPYEATTVKTKTTKLVTVAKTTTKRVTATNKVSKEEREWTPPIPKSTKDIRISTEDSTTENEATSTISTIKDDTTSEKNTIDVTNTDTNSVEPQTREEITTDDYTLNEKTTSEQFPTDDETKISIIDISTSDDSTLSETSEDAIEEVTTMSGTSEDVTEDGTTVSETSQDTTEEETTMSETSENATEEETTISETSEDATEEVTTMSGTSEDVTEDGTTVSETSEDATEEETTLRETSENATEEETTVSETSEDATEEVTTMSGISEDVTEDGTTVSETSEDATEEEATISETSEDATEEETTMNETSENATEDETTMNETSENATEDETTVSETSEDATEEETTMIKTSENATEEEATISETSEDATEEETTMNETSENATEDETTVSETLKDATEEETTVSETSDDTTDVVTTSPNTEAATTSEIEKSTTEQEEFICPAKKGKYSSQTDCSKYYSCKNGVANLEQCGIGTLFDEDLGFCMAKDSVDCGTRKITLEETITVDEIFVCPDEKSKKYPFPDDCSKYFQCKKGISTVRTCGEGTLYDLELLACMAQGTVDCSDREKTPKSEPQSQLYHLRPVQRKGHVITETKPALKITMD